MNVLVVGSGGREHALVWKISRSRKVDKIYCAPGNPGIAQLAECVPISVDDIDQMAQFAQKNKVDLTVVGPELPLVLGIADKFRELGLRLIGPDKACSKFEGSKSFTKRFLDKYAIPTARYSEYEDLSSAIKGLREFALPVVIKADGLAAGKGVVIAENYEIAEKTLVDMMDSLVFGDAGKKVVLEEFLTGTEASVLCFVDGHTIVPMESAQDYKRVGNGDTGKNTGGMGSYSPNRLFDSKLKQIIQDKILNPISKGFKSEGYDYKGILFIGLMIQGDRPKVLEFNVRFGDPETQSVILRLKTDIIEIFESILNGNLQYQTIEWSPQKSVCVVAASGGYPDMYDAGKEISGLEDVKDSIVFHAGTKEVEGKIVTCGGRVLGVAATGTTLDEARDKAYSDIGKISFEGIHYRRDITS